MARVAATLRALATTVWRDQRSLGSFTTNNFFIFTLILLQHAGVFIYLILGLVILFPLSSGPLGKIPPERWNTWPLTGGQRRLIRVLSPWVNPVTWFLAALAVWAAAGAVSFGLLAVFATLVAASSLLPRSSGPRQEAIWRRIPTLPGPQGELVSKNLRGLVSTLDFYCALILSATGTAYCLFVEAAPPEARLAITLLIVLALSSHAQCLFGLEGEAGLTRYRLLPLRGWQVLAAKDTAFLIAVTLLTMPLAQAAGLAAALAALAIGHSPSVRAIRPQIRWRFSSGASIPNGLLQVFLMTLAGVTTFRTGYWVVIPCAAICATSTWWFGRTLDRATPETAGHRKSPRIIF